MRQRGGQLDLRIKKSRYCEFRFFGSQLAIHYAMRVFNPAASLQCELANSRLDFPFIQSVASRAFNTGRRLSTRARLEAYVDKVRVKYPTFAGWLQ